MQLIEPIFFCNFVLFEKTKLPQIVCIIYLQDSKIIERIVIIEESGPVKHTSRAFKCHFDFLSQKTIVPSRNCLPITILSFRMKRSGTSIEIGRQNMYMHQFIKHLHVSLPIYVLCVMCFAIDNSSTTTVELLSMVLLNSYKRAITGF